MSLVVIAELVADDAELQIVAANLDKLVLVLVTYFYHKPSEEDDPHQHDMYNKLCQVGRPRNVMPSTAYCFHVCIECLDFAS